MDENNSKHFQIILIIREGGSRGEVLIYFLIYLKIRNWVIITINITLSQAY